MGRSRGRSLSCPRASSRDAAVLQGDPALTARSSTDDTKAGRTPAAPAERTLQVRRADALATVTCITRKAGHHDKANAEAPHHAGDLGNLEADDHGKTHSDMVIENISLLGPKNPILGRAVIIDEK
ncbi:MAG: superoxide dismutase family protein [Planctomycetota bacterium]